MLLQAALWLALHGLVEDRIIVSTSMQPTLAKGEIIRLANNRFYSQFGPYLSGPPERGDVVLARIDFDGLSQDFVMRIIALPGETVEMRSGRLHIDGTIVERRPLGSFTDQDWSGEPVAVERYIELLPDAPPHQIQEIDDAQMLDDTPVYEIPADHYFAMGDNRDNSMDSRVSDMVGFIPRQAIIAQLPIPAADETP